jgi:hypothetical protein
MSNGCLSTQAQHQGAHLMSAMMKMREAAEAAPRILSYIDYAFPI